MKNRVKPIPATETYFPPDPDPKRQRVLELLVIGNSVSAAKSPKGASNDGPGRGAGGKQPSVARPPQPPAASSTPGAKVTLITKAKCRHENARTVQTVQSIDVIENTSHLTANQSLPVTKATIELPSEIAETVQTVQTTGHREPDSPDSELPPVTPKTETWSSGQVSDSRSPITNHRKPRPKRRRRQEPAGRLQ